MISYASSLAPSMVFLISVSGLRERRNVIHQSQILLFKDNRVILMLWFLYEIINTQENSYMMLEVKRLGKIYSLSWRKIGHTEHERNPL